MNEPEGLRVDLTPQLPSPDPKNCREGWIQRLGASWQSKTGRLSFLFFFFLRLFKLSQKRPDSRKEVDLGGSSRCVGH